MCIKSNVGNIMFRFIKKVQSMTMSSGRVLRRSERIQHCEDWEIAWDEDKSPAMFPPVIVVTAKRPDVTIYSTSEKKYVVIELTVPAEENLAQANNRKKCKYADLIHECQEAGWDVRYFPVEVGSRGFTNQTLRACFKYLDLSNKEIRLAIDEISKTALKSHLYHLVGKK